MSEKKPEKTSKQDVAKSAAQGGLEGAMSSSSDMSNVSVGRIENDKEKIGKLKKNVKSGDLQNGLKHKMKDNMKPSNMMKGGMGNLSAQEAKNVGKGAVQFYKGDYVGLSETAADTANDMADEEAGKKADKKQKKEDKKLDQKQASEAPKNTQAGDAASPDKASSLPPEEDKKKLTGGKKAAIAIGAAAAGAQVFILLKISQFFHMLMLLLLQLFHALVALATAVIAAIVHAVATVAVMLGVSMFIAATGLVGVAIIATITLFGGFGAMSESSQAAVRDGDLVSVDKEDPCAGRSIEFRPVSVGSDELTNMQNVYSVMSTLGFSNEAIAGLFGNFCLESGGLDPASIEGLYAEPYIYGEKHAAIMEPIAAYHTHSSTIANGNTGYNYAGEAWCGIGFAQWTADRASALLDYADTLPGHAWYDLDTQIAYMISKDSGKGFFDNWKLNMPTNPEDAAEDFCKLWEIPAHMSTQVTLRRAQAAIYFVQIAEWQADTTYANTIIDLAKLVNDEAAASGNKKYIDDGCGTGPVYTYGNSLAEKMVAYSWPTVEESQLNNGTPMYIAVHDGIFPGDTLYQSCDRSVSSAVRWSGVDDSYPVGDTSTQYMYLYEHPEKWQPIPTFRWNNWPGGWNMLLPGDIIICPQRFTRPPPSSYHGHTVMFLGNELIRKTYPQVPENAAYCIGSGAFEERSPACGMPYFNDSRALEYKAFRAIAKEPNPQYTDILS